ncbi:MAG: hypothetical protein QXP36_11240, partial [Conexivisphaerales archaeon]
KSVVVDGSIQGFLIWPKNNTKDISFNIYYSMQSLYDIFIYSGSVLFVAPFAIVYIYKRKDCR